MTNSSINPIVFLDIAVANVKLGRVVIELFKDKVPKTAENFRVLCTGEKENGINGKPLHYKGSIFHRVVSKVMVQGGDIVNFDGSSGESIYGLYFEDEDLKTLHNDKGLLSMVNEGKPNSNSSQFVITMSSCPQLNNTNVVFGKVIKGMGVIDELNEVPIDGDKPMEMISITNCGELTGLKDWKLEDNEGEDVYTPFPEDATTTLDNLTYANIVDIIKRIKNVGNAYFVKRKYSSAEVKYKKALRYYEYMINEKNVPSNHAEIENLKIVMLLNLAAVKLHQLKYKDTISLCEQVLSLDSKNSKALFRRGQAHMGLNEYELGLSDFTKAYEESPKNKDILKEIDKVKKIINSYLQFEKATCKRMFQCK